MRKGTFHTKQTKRKMSEVCKGRIFTEETRKKLSLASKGENNPMYGKHHSEETKRKLSLALKGEKNSRYNKPLSEEIKKKMSESHKGKIFSKEHRQKLSETHKGKCHSEETKQKISKTEMGRFVSEETKQKMSESNKGKHYPSEETLKKMRSAQIGRIGEKSPNWKGGITPLVRRIRACIKYEEWQLMVFGRDNFTCQDCGKRGVYLCAHHKKSFSSIMQYYEITNMGETLKCKELWDINNGVTLCIECHKNIHFSKK